VPTVFALCCHLPAGAEASTKLTIFKVAHQPGLEANRGGSTLRFAAFLLQACAVDAPIYLHSSLPDSTDAPSCQDIVARVTFHQHQVGAQSWGNATAIMEAKDACRSGRCCGERLDRGEPSLDEQFQLAMEAGSMHRSGHGCIGSCQDGDIGSFELAQGRFGVARMGIRSMRRILALKEADIFSSEIRCQPTSFTKAVPPDPPVTLSSTVSVGITQA
jgi:hypothetical protein